MHGDALQRKSSFSTVPLYSLSTATTTTATTTASRGQVPLPAAEHLLLLLHRGSRKDGPDLELARAALQQEKEVVEAESVGGDGRKE